MSNSFNNYQLFLGNRDWKILSDNYGRGPIDYPLKFNNTENKEKANTNAPIDMQNVVGHMGEDEDLEQAQYNVMSMLDVKLENMKSHLSKTVGERFETLNNEIQQLKTNLENQETAFESRRDEVDTRLTSRDTLDNESFNQLLNDVRDLEAINQRELQVMTDNFGPISGDSTTHVINQLDTLNQNIQTQSADFQELRNRVDDITAQQTNQDNTGDTEDTELKVKGNYYYPENTTFYNKYKKYPYFIKFETEYPNDQECITNDETKICEVQAPITCNINGNLNSSSIPGKFRKIKDEDSECELKYDPNEQVFKCGDITYKDLLYPHPIISKDEIKLCFGEEYNNKVPLINIPYILFYTYLSLVVLKIILSLVIL